VDLEEDMLTSTPSTSENNRNKPFKKRIDDYFKTKSPQAANDLSTSLEATISNSNTTPTETQLENTTAKKEEETQENTINSTLTSSQVYPIFNTAKSNSSKSNSSGSSSNNNSTNSSNNTLDELLEELDKSNSKLIQETRNIRQEMDIDESSHETTDATTATTMTDENKANAQQSANILDRDEVALLSREPLSIPHEASFSYIKHCELNSGESEVFRCRLCHLKLNSQRSLHEHVARIHGGKGGLFNSSLFPCTMGSEEVESDAFNENEEDSSDLDVISKFNSRGSSFKKKFVNDFMPHPNVAIRYKSDYV